MKPVPEFKSEVDERVKTLLKYCIRKFDSTEISQSRKSCPAKQQEGWSHTVIRFRGAGSMFVRMDGLMERGWVDGWRKRWMFTLYIHVFLSLSVCMYLRLHQQLFTRRAQAYSDDNDYVIVMIMVMMVLLYTKHPNALLDPCLFPPLLPSKSLT